MNNKQIINFKIDEKRIVISTLDSVNHVQFSFDIKQVENFGDMLVVRLKIPVGTTYNENVFGVSYDGKILWQIEKLKYVYNDSPFTGMVREGNNIKLCNWDGTDLIVNSQTGEIISKGWSK
ncbi:MAG: hypothetical protein QG624_564 [Pseudomonadota bacterium]|jgi:hypothetical protein|nr:hypothetical protein [Pseudomonadota bacterium]